MSDVHEHLEHAEHVEHAAHSNKKIALVIAVLALFLAFSETLGKGAQTGALSENIQASDLWNFFQAKTIRQTVLRTAGETNAIGLMFMGFGLFSPETLEHLQHMLEHAGPVAGH